MTNFGSPNAPASHVSRFRSPAVLAPVVAMGLVATAWFAGCTNGATVLCGPDAGCGTGVFFSDASSEARATDGPSEGAASMDGMTTSDAPGSNDAGTDSGDDAGTDSGSDAASEDAASSDAPVTDAPVDSPTQG
jgi:hypothetical protein